MNSGFRFALILLSAATTFAAEISSADRAQFHNGKVWLTPGSGSMKAPDVVFLPFQIRIETNGTYTVGGGKTRQLLEEEIIGRDGMLLRADGSIIPVMDHLTLNRGRVLVMRDGDYQQMDGDLQLGGTFVRADGKITTADGSSRRLLDGELYLLNGASMASRDTVTVRDGQVLVQKDGTMIALGSGRTIMMNDGTKVFSDGTIIDFFGRRAAVGDGGVAVLQGVSVRPR
jgi:hypothetical protein